VVKSLNDNGELNSLTPMYVCVCVCVCIWLCVCMCVCVCVCTCVCVVQIAYVNITPNCPIQGTQISHHITSHHRQIIVLCRTHTPHTQTHTNTNTHTHTHTHTHRIFLFHTSKHISLCSHFALFCGLSLNCTNNFTRGDKNPRKRVCTHRLM